MNKAGGIRLPDISLYYTATVIKTVWYWPKKKKKNQTHRSMGQNREVIKKTHALMVKQSMRKETRIYNRERIYNKRKDNRFNNWCWENWTATCKKLTEHFLTPYTEINSKWIKDQT